MSGAGRAARCGLTRSLRRRLPTCDPRVEEYGEVDEPNAAVGLALVALPARSRFRPWLGRSRTTCSTWAQISPLRDADSGERLRL